MQTEEITRLDAMEQQIGELAIKTDDNGMKLDYIVRALKGDDLGTTGLVARMANLEKEVTQFARLGNLEIAFAKETNEKAVAIKELQKQVEDLKTKEIISGQVIKTLTKISWILVTALVVSIVALIFKQVHT